MSEWMGRLIKKHTCMNCEVTLNKDEIYSVHMETAEGPHTVQMCETCAMEFNDILEALEKVR
jgi:RNase P subunit RPR2